MFRLIAVARRWLGRLEAACLVRLGHSPLSVLFRTRALVLETRGRRSGLVRRTPLACLDLTVPAESQVDGRPTRLLVVGGAGGQTRMPDWVANLRADPAVHVVVDRRRWAATATELDGADRARAWDRARAAWPRIERYERRAGRPVPVVRLDLV